MPSLAFTAKPPLPRESNDARSTPPPLPKDVVATDAGGRKLVGRDEDRRVGGGGGRRVVALDPDGAAAAAGETEEAAEVATGV